MRGRCQQPVHLLFVSVRGRVREIRPLLFGGGRQEVSRKCWMEFFAATFVYPLCVNEAVEIGKRMLRETGFKQAKECEVDSTMVTSQNATRVYDQSSLEGIQ